MRPFHPSDPSRVDGPRPGGRLPLRVALIGDSLSTSFRLGSVPSMLWLARRTTRANWFLDPTGRIESFCQRAGAEVPVTGWHLAKVSARVDHPVDPRKMLKRLAGMQPFSVQLGRLLRPARLPDMVLLWIGHNNVDWVGSHPAGRPVEETLARVAWRFRLNYQRHLLALLRRADRDAAPLTICVFGLIDFAAFFEARRAMEAARERDLRRYPFLEVAYGTFPSMRPNNRASMITLAERMNRHLEELVAGLNQRPAAHPGVKLIYSDAFARSGLCDPRFYSEMDGWHPSAEGHGALAEAAWSVLRHHLPRVPRELPLQASPER